MPLDQDASDESESSAHPVAKTAVVAKAVTPGPVAGREDRRRRRGRHTGTGRPPADLSDPEAGGAAV